MTKEQKDSMMAQIIEQIQDQITYLVDQDLIQESYSLYKEWEEHLNPKYSQLEIITVIDLTTI
mgnify:CR=1 FL=1|jgi:tartrate dehydratase alpha subunit/fumarate hydratase class I-like protein